MEAKTTKHGKSKPGGQHVDEIMVVFESHEVCFTLERTCIGCKPCVFSNGRDSSPTSVAARGQHEITSYCCLFQSYRGTRLVSRLHLLWTVVKAPSHHFNNSKLRKWQTLQACALRKHGVRTLGQRVRSDLC